MIITPRFHIGLNLERIQFLLNQGLRKSALAVLCLFSCLRRHGLARAVLRKSCECWRVKLKKMALIGAPSSVGVNIRGTELGPDALRIAGLVEALNRRGGLEVIDRGNINGPVSTATEKVDGWRGLDAVVQWNQLIFNNVLDNLEKDYSPVLLGGDHSLVIGSISAAAHYANMQGKKLRVLWFDAHTDANTAAMSPSGNMHGTPVACLLGHGPEQLTHLAGTRALTKENIFLLGIRSVDEHEKKFVQQLGIEIFDMRFIDEFGIKQAMQRVLHGVDANTHLHVSFDCDCLDPAIAPGVTTDVRGGLSYREAQLCMEMICDTGLLGSVDLMELNPARDVRNMTAELLVDLLESLLGKSTLVRPYSNFK